VKRDDAARFLQINLIGPMLAIQIEAPVLVRNGGGAIVCTASVAGLRSVVRVNGCPGLTETGMTKPFFDSAAAKGTTGKLLQLNPLWCAGQPEKIAKVALFPTSGDASYINGTRSCLIRDDARRLSSTPRQALQSP
jgi:NAD(P)-dependent dehydrogenase (short-subunit alcohol dehydrogenase family)